jgi:putative addiction module component (TIGR02574 family)
LDAAQILQAMRTWSVENQMELLFRAWDQLVDAGWQPELTDELKAELNRRIAAYQVTPNRVVSWDEVVAHAKHP